MATVAGFAQASNFSVMITVMCWQPNGGKNSEEAVVVINMVDLLGQGTGQEIFARVCGLGCNHS